MRDSMMVRGCHSRPVVAARFHGRLSLAPVLIAAALSCTRHRAHELEARPDPVQSLATAAVVASNDAVAAIDDEVDAGVDDIPEWACVSGDPATLASRVRVQIEPSTNLSLEWMSSISAHAISGEVAVAITNLSAERICVRHYDSFSVRFLERHTGRQEYLEHSCQCAGLAKGARGTRLVLAAGQTRRWREDSLHFGCAPITVRPGDYDLLFAVLPGEHRVPPPYVDFEADPAGAQRRCDSLMRSKSFWSAAVSSPAIRVVLTPGKRDP